jgi:hypothetical protein
MRPGTRLLAGEEKRPPYAAWEAAVLPLNYARKSLKLFIIPNPPSDFSLSFPCQVAGRSCPTVILYRLGMPRSNRLGIHENEDREHNSRAFNFNREAQRRTRLQIDRKRSPILIARLISAR